MEEQKSFLESLQDDYDWQELTNNYNERKMIEVVENLTNNATERMYTLICIANSSDDGVNEAFLKTHVDYYGNQQIKEILAGRDVLADYEHLLKGEDWQCEWDFLCDYIQALQRALRRLNNGEYGNNGVFHVENINNYGYISDVLNQLYRNRRYDCQEFE